MAPLVVEAHGLSGLRFVKAEAEADMLHSVEPEVCSSSPSDGIQQENRRAEEEAANRSLGIASDGREENVGKDEEQVEMHTNDLGMNEEQGKEGGSNDLEKEEGEEEKEEEEEEEGEKEEEEEGEEEEAVFGVRNCFGFGDTRRFIGCVFIKIGAFNICICFALLSSFSLFLPVLPLLCIPPSFPSFPSSQQPDSQLLSVSSLAPPFPLLLSPSLSPPPPPPLPSIILSLPFSEPPLPPENPSSVDAMNPLLIARRPT
ncbi:uncharacterized protein MONOS_15015 [Monocercomonoides exilis]|uniref:uncharacterized protein n=1 Tax=Monocercomonoides exilis TaxID=2049356 RepID=UPI00355946A1|nr:hypothetical protein MONOS_15015 [Monocercomonoides exilis]|eukprot:MONOS_15015.1-p1 / transcript=MONOS_15015.1 / gene=MONOS_15015 / organism=Monocercomonoides_exilis_PA203 / gene_product=unspecified product / transcript_product=unspecified product / location=Mono_scaffold01127:3402-4175(-) / protein_length=258 / sequence_SO=supercontig / SO=protein_coding / is_pseudo=false